MTLSINIQHNSKECLNAECRQAECRYADCRDYLNVRLSIVRLNVVMLIFVTPVATNHVLKLIIVGENIKNASVNRLTNFAIVWGCLLSH